MNMHDRLTKSCTRRHECEWRDRCAIAHTGNAQLPITPANTADGCDWFDEQPLPFGVGPDGEEND